MTTVMHNANEIRAFLVGIGEDFARTPFEPFLRDELSLVSDQYSYYFAEQAGPDGAAWQANAPSTIKQKGHQRILRGKPDNQNRLSLSLTRKAADGDAVRDVIHVSNTFFAIHGTDVEYSVWNDRGTGRIPARHHIGVSVSYFDAFCNRAIDYAFQKLVRAA